MCRTGEPCPELTWEQLRDLTRLTTRSPLWRGQRAVHVSRERRPGIHGSTSGRCVRYAERAPLCTVAHELAHVVKGPEHGSAWAVEFSRLHVGICTGLGLVRFGT